MPSAIARRVPSPGVGADEDLREHAEGISPRPRSERDAPLEVQGTQDRRWSSVAAALPGEGLTRGPEPTGAAQLELGTVGAEARVAGGLRIPPQTNSSKNTGVSLGPSEKASLSAQRLASVRSASRGQAGASGHSAPGPSVGKPVAPRESKTIRAQSEASPGRSSKRTPESAASMLSASSRAAEQRQTRARCSQRTAGSPRPHSEQSVPLSGRSASPVNAKTSST